MERAIMCPQCNAPLTPGRFTRQVVCSYCGATVRLDEASVSAATFHEAFKAWNSPSSYQLADCVSVGNSHWALEECIAHGEIADVYTARRARWPTELAILKVLRERKDQELLEAEWQAVQELQASQAPGAETFTRLIPQPITHGQAGPGPHAGQGISVFRRAGGFRHTFAQVMQAYPQGIEPQASVWMWRRILEVLSFLHASGLAHGALLPDNLLVQDDEHGVRLVGYGRAGHFGQKLRSLPPDSAAFYPGVGKSLPALTAQLDLALSARCIVAVLGGDPGTASLPAAVPQRLAKTVRRVALSAPGELSDRDAWVLREELGSLAQEVFGPPKFMPIVMPTTDKHG